MARRALVVVALAAAFGTIPVAARAGGGGCGEVTAGSGRTVEFRYACITPAIVRVDVGDEVTFVNRDDFRHIITGAGFAWGSDGYFGAGDVLTVTFRSDGLYPYQCYLHPGMAGVVVAGTGTGLGAADRGGVVVTAPDDPTPDEVVYLTRPPEIRTVRAVDPSVLALGAAIGVGAAALLALGARIVRRRPTQEDGS